MATIRWTFSKFRERRTRGLTNSSLDNDCENFEVSVEVEKIRFIRSSSVFHPKLFVVAADRPVLVSDIFREEYHFGDFL